MIERLGADAVELRGRLRAPDAMQERTGHALAQVAVSYTHLTLPTSDLV